MWKENMPSQGSRPASDMEPAQETVIGREVHIKGDLKSSSGALIQGHVEGELEVGGRLIVGESGQIVGDIAARSVIVRGSVRGRIIAGERIELGSSGRVEGDLQAKAVSIAEGAYFQGKVEMTADSQSPSVRQKKAHLVTAGATA